MNTLLKNFLTYQEAPETTEKTYTHTINEFIKWYEMNYNEFIAQNIKKIDIRHINEYILYLSSKDNSLATKKRKLSTLKSFFIYLIEYGYMKNNPVNNSNKKIRSIFSAKEEKVRMYFSVDEVKLLLKNIGDNIRDNAIIQLYLNTGLRLSELAKLNIGSVANDELIIKGKNDKERIVYLNSHIKELLNKYISTLDSQKLNEPLFKSYLGDRLSERSIQKMISKIEKKVGLKTGVHLLRHTFATYMLQEANADITQIQTLLGHSSVTTTQEYAKVSEKKLKNLVNKNPIGLTNFS